MKKVLRFSLVTISLFMIMSSTNKIDKETKVKPCLYYSYVVYGDAMTNGKLNNFESVYKGFNIYKSTAFACFDNYRGTKSGKFTVINIGPYETEAVIYQEINRVRNNLKEDGYKEARKFKHLVTGVILEGYGNAKCK